MNELIKHIEGINAKTQKWIDEDPTNRWAGMITTDPKHWEEYGITTPLEYDKYMLAETIADASKSAYGSKFRVDPDEHTLEELQEMADRYCQAASEEYEREQKFYAEQVEAFKYLVQKTIDLGAGNEETALRWLTSGEKFYHSQDVESWVWDNDILFTDYGKELVKKLEKIVTYEEWQEAA